jgi:hypothetical protein
MGQLIEKHWEFGNNTIIVWVDFEKGYNRKKKEIWSALRRLKVAEYFIQKVELTCSDWKNSVETN